MTTGTVTSPMLSLPGAVAGAAGPDDAVAAHYGQPMREQRTLAGAAGLVDLSHRGVLAIAGDDRLSWLHTLGTQYLQPPALPAGQGSELLLLSPHGHLEHHALLLDDGATTWLDTEPGGAAPLLEFLDSMRFMLRVEPRDVGDEHGVLGLVGPAAPAALSALGLPEPPAPAEVRTPPGPQFATGSVPPRPTSRYPVTTLPGGGFVRRRPPLPAEDGPDIEVFDLLVPRQRLAEVADTLRDAGIPACGLLAYEALRVAGRRPRFGADTDHRTIPAETGLLAPAVHLDKGCYRGQETVARVHNLGRPPRRPVLLQLDGSDASLPDPGSEVTRDGRRVGVTGTAVRHFEQGPIALALVKQNVPAEADLRVADQPATIDPA